jgi:endonuclease/exonuclease/phosphatase family metal-dependent hydrolase
MVARLSTAVVLALALGQGCATAHNYLEPGGPRFTGGHGVPTDPDPAIHVVTFNVEYGKQVDRAIEALRQDPLRGADVVTLQEMDGSGVEAVARALAMNFVYYSASRHPKTGRDLGNAILSPWPIEDSRKVLLPHPSRIVKQARAAVAATVRVDGLAVRVYSIHLGSPLGISGGKRRDQADVVLADARTSAYPVILAGDFNSKGLGDHIQAQGFDWPTKGVGRTIGPFSFDHVFVRGLRLRDPRSTGVAREGPKASDHRPVWVELVPEESAPHTSLPVVHSVDPSPSGRGGF